MSVCICESRLMRRTAIESCCSDNLLNWYVTPRIGEAILVEAMPDGGVQRRRGAGAEVKVAKMFRPVHDLTFSTFVRSITPWPLHLIFHRHGGHQAVCAAFQRLSAQHRLGPCASQWHLSKIPLLVANYPRRAANAVVNSTAAFSPIG